MTSANTSLNDGTGAGFWREQRAITSRRLALASLSALFFMVFDLFLTVWLIQRERAVPYAVPEGFALRGADIVSKWMGVRGPGFVTAMVGAILLGIQAFSFLYKQQTVDFFESRPEKRSVRFRNLAVNSVLVYAVPSFVGSILSYLVAVVNGCGPKWLFCDMIAAWVMQLSLFLAMLGVSVLAALLTGTVVTAILMNAFLLGFEALVRLTVYFYSYTYYATFDSGSRKNVLTAFWTLPPFHYLKGLIAAGLWDKKTYGRAESLAAIEASIPGLVCNLLIFSITIALSLIVYEKRKSEAAGMSVIWRPVAEFVKWWSVTFFSLFAGVAVFWSFGRRGMAELSTVVVAIVIVVFVGSLVLEAIFWQNIRKALYRFWEIPAIGVIAIVFLFVYRTDALGYDTYLPKADRVESAWLLNERYNSMSFNEDGSVGSRRQYVSDHMRLTDTEAMLELVRIGMEERVREAKRMRGIEPDLGFDLTIGWRLSGGRVVTRRIKIPETVDAALMDRVVSGDEYVTGHYQWLDAPEKIRAAWEKREEEGGLVFEVSTEHGERSFDTDMEGLLEVLRQDMASHYCYSEAAGKAPIGALTVRPSEPWGSFSIQYPIFEDFTETISWLSDRDLWPGGFLAADEYERAQVVLITHDESGMAHERVWELADIESIQKILDTSLSGKYHSAWSRNSILERNNRDSSGIWDVLLFAKLPGEKEERVFTRDFRKGEVPGFLK